MSWTEEDQIRYEAESKERKRKIILKKLEEAQRRYDEADRNYQDTGSSSCMRTMNRHNDMIMICGLALQALDSICGKCERQRKKIGDAIDKYRYAKEKDDRYLLDFDRIINDFMDLY